MSAEPQTQPPLPPEISPAELERHQARQEAIAQAHAAPLPGPLLDAFLPEPITAAGLALRPVVAADAAILHRLGSPLLEQLRELQKPQAERKAIEFTDEDLWELLYLWTRPPREARAALAAGRQGFRETALQTTADQFEAGILLDGQPMIRALVNHYLNAFSTRIGYGPAPEPGAQTFTAPPASQAMG